MIKINFEKKDVVYIYPGIYVENNVEYEFKIYSYDGYEEITWLGNEPSSQVNDKILEQFRNHYF